MPYAAQLRALFPTLELEVAAVLGAGGALGQRPAAERVLGLTLLGRAGGRPRGRILRTGWRRRLGRSLRVRLLRLVGRARSQQGQQEPRPVRQTAAQHRPPLTAMTWPVM